MKNLATLLFDDECKLLVNDKPTTCLMKNPGYVEFDIIQFT